MASSIPHPVRRLLPVFLAAVTLLATVSCGTILYPERRGQPVGPLDPKVVVLDGLGLLFFFVPGVIAFAVDFATGAIYLPPAGYGESTLPGFEPERWTWVSVPPEELNRQRIAQVVSGHTGKAVSLEPGTFVVRTGDDVIVRSQSPTGNEDGVETALPPVTDVWWPPCAKTTLPLAARKAAVKRR